MKTIVLGATGFIGRHVVAELLNRNHSVTAVGRQQSKAELLGSSDSLRYVNVDLYHSDWGSPLELFGGADAVIDLVWPGLPNYLDLFHIERNQPNSYRMLKRFVQDGYDNILVAGTCYEYGLQHGPLSASTPTQPVAPYGMAKNGLHEWLRMLQLKKQFRLKWARLFYVHGEGQFPGSLIPQLQSAITDGNAVFNMSAGEQLRDFLPIEQAACQIVNLCEHPTANGSFNVCSGQAMSVRKLVEQVIAERKSSISLNLGHYPYPSHEPMAFWGVPSQETEQLTGVRN